MKIVPVEKGGSISVYHTADIERLEATEKQLENLIRDMLFDIPVIPDRYKYVNRLKEIDK